MLLENSSSAVIRVESVTCLAPRAGFSQACLRLAGMISIFVALVVPSATAAASEIGGVVHGSDGEAIEGAMVSLSSADPVHRITVFSDEHGRFAATVDDGVVDVRVRRIGWKDANRWGVTVREGLEADALDLTLERETDPVAVAAQLPANRWYSLVLEELADQPAQREQLVRQCTYCHQQGSIFTRIERTPEQWNKLLALMARMGAVISSDLHERIPELFTQAYAMETAVPKLTATMSEPGFAPPPSPTVRQAVIEEWDLGHPASMQHDLVVHPDGRVYSVDMTQDQLYRLDASVPGGERKSWPVPNAGLPLGGVFGGDGAPTPSNARASVGPHSLQVAPDGAIWTTLALGNQLARFDPNTEEWSFYPLEEGFYPHTLRIDRKSRVWYTVAASNHLGMFDPATQEHTWIRLPTKSWGQAIMVRMVPAFLWLTSRFDLGGGAAGEGGASAGSDLPEMPIPYGIDIAPNGDIWFSQLNNHRIGRVDPETLDVEMVDTPFTAPRRLRFDSKGQLWIPGFSSGLISRFDTETRVFKSWTLPIEPIGSETPYALHVNHATDEVWICGTNSDSLIRFEPAPERFTVYPLPTRVTYTRELDFDSLGRVWTSNSNMPSWQIEDGKPKVLRLDPRGSAAEQPLAAMP